MFHRLTLFDSSNKLDVGTIDKAFYALQAPIECYRHSSSGHCAVHQWQWTSSDGAKRLTNNPSECVFTLEEMLTQLSKKNQLDYVIQSSALPIEKIKLAVFDMDSTLIKAEVMDELAYVMGIGPQVALITARSMAGELDFEQSFRQRLALLTGFDTAQLSAINDTIELMPGAQKLMEGLQEQGIYCAILSGGFSYFADHLAHKLGMQDAFSNPLEEVDGKLTGKVKGVILDAARKVELMEQLRKTLGLSLNQCLAVGDGANDLPMLNKAGLGVAFHGKPLVRQQAPHQLNNVNLDALLHLV